MTAKYDIDMTIGHSAIDPTTFAPMFVHPMLWYNYNTLTVELKSEIKDWLDLTMKDRWRFEINKSESYIEFNNDADQTWFKLKWSL